MPTHEKSPAHTPTPWICSHSQNPDVYRNEEHWLIVSHPVQSTAEAIADIETGPGPKTSRANAEFIVRACNAHDDLLEALQLAENTVRTAQVFETPGSGEHQQYEWVLSVIHAAMNKAYGHAA